MNFNKITRLYRIAFFTLLTAMLIACGGVIVGTAPGSIDISDYSLSYNDIIVPSRISSSISTAPNWSTTPPQVRYSISPNPPQGVNFDTDTGVLSGSINTLTSTSYTVIATGNGNYTGRVIASFTIIGITPINLSSVGFSYPDINVYVSNHASISPIWTNHAYPMTATYTVNPPLPSGLSLNTNTGVVSGIPTYTMVTSNYTITATGNELYTGSKTTTFNLTVANHGGTLLNTLNLSYNNIGVNYNNGVEVYTINISDTPNPTINDVIPQWNTTPPNITYSVNPSLPSWLTLNANNGVISRTTSPINAYYRHHTITAESSGGGGYSGTATATMTIAIAVNASNNIQSLVNEQITDQGNYPNLNIIDTSRVTSMNGLFQGKANFNGDISKWDVNGVTNMGRMFWLANSFNEDISRWNVGKVTDMSYMFNEASSFNQNISNWNVSNVTSMSSMFNRANVFNGDISRWNVGKVIDMSYMFNQASSFNQDISRWNVSNVTTMNSMFNQASSFNQDISRWNVSNVTTMSSMFNRASSFNQDISRWNVSNVTTMNSMFNRASSFNQDISRWNISNVTTMWHMFYSASAFQGTGLSSWAGKLGKVTTMQSMFEGATAFVENLEAWNVSSNTIITDMFLNSGVAGKPTWCTTNRGC